MSFPFCLQRSWGRAPYGSGLVKMADPPDRIEPNAAELFLGRRGALNVARFMSGIMGSP